MKKIVVFLSSFAFVALWSTMAFAQGVGAADNYFSMYSMFAIGAGFGIGIAAFGGSMGQGRAAAAALEGIARNPTASGKLFTPLILGLALIESLVIYALLISFLIVNNIDMTVLQ